MYIINYTVYMSINSCYCNMSETIICYDSLIIYLFLSSDLLIKFTMSGETI